MGNPRLWVGLRETNRKTMILAGALKKHTHTCMMFSNGYCTYSGRSKDGWTKMAKSIPICVTRSPIPRGPKRARACWFSGWPWHASTRTTMQGHLEWPGPTAPGASVALLFAGSAVARATPPRHRRCKGRGCHRCEPPPPQAQTEQQRQAPAEQQNNNGENKNAHKNGNKDNDK